MSRRKRDSISNRAADSQVAREGGCLWNELKENPLSSRSPRMHHSLQRVPWMTQGHATWGRRGESWDSHSPSPYDVP